MLKIIIIIVSLAAPYFIGLLTSLAVLAGYGGYVDNTYESALKDILIVSIPLIAIVGFIYDYKVYLLQDHNYKTAAGYVISSVAVSLITIAWIMIQDMPENYS